MTIAYIFLRSILCHLLLSITMGSPHETHFLKNLYQSKIILDSKRKLKSTFLAHMNNSYCLISFCTFCVFHL